MIGGLRKTLYIECLGYCCSLLELSANLLVANSASSHVEQVLHCLVIADCGHQGCLCMCSRGGGTALKLEQLQEHSSS